MVQPLCRLQSKKKRILVNTIACTLGIVFANEYLIYYITLWKCEWPELPTSSAKSDVHHPPLRLLVLADPHLLGDVKGHWFDKLRRPPNGIVSWQSCACREWQMLRSYQTALQLFQPSAVFILGDIFDEGKWATAAQWSKYVARAEEVFMTPGDVALHVVVGNHDVGFHYHVTKTKLDRFFKTFNTGNVKAITMEGNVFIILNSMGFDNDGCSMCNDVQIKMKQLTKDLSCNLKEDTMDCVPAYGVARPIVLQHFPLYRESDALCKDIDSAPKDEVKMFVPKHDCLTKEASQQILESFKPRLVLSGHTHDACSHYHDDGTLEVSVPSFSWRNRPNPSFTLITISNDDFAISKCFLPHERTVMFIYALFPFLLASSIYSLLRRPNKNYF